MILPNIWENKKCSKPPIRTTNQRMMGVYACTLMALEIKEPTRATHRYNVKAPLHECCAANHLTSVSANAQLAQLWKLSVEIYSATIC